jgi:RHS repeat-associated protein
MGAPTTNPFQFTGRENDGTGLYHYRARYYKPDIRRFVSEDTLGLAGGDLDLYTYTGNRPTVLSDPGGEAIPAVLGMMVLGAATGAGSQALGTIIGFGGWHEAMQHRDFLESALYRGAVSGAVGAGVGVVSGSPWAAGASAAAVNNAWEQIQGGAGLGEIAWGKLLVATGIGAALGFVQDAIAPVARTVAEKTGSILVRMPMNPRTGEYGLDWAEKIRWVPALRDVGEAWVSRLPVFVTGAVVNGLAKRSPGGCR